MNGRKREWGKVNYGMVYFLIFLIFSSGCALVDVTTETAKIIGKVGWEATKITGKVLWTAGKAAGGGVKTLVHIARGKQVIKLKKIGNSFYADVKLNRKVKATFLVDTGASSVQISQGLARKLRINPAKGDPLMAQIADGQMVSGHAVNLKEVRMGRVYVKNVRAVVLDNEVAGKEKEDGLLGMSFLNHFVFQMDTEKGQLILQKRPH